MFTSRTALLLGNDALLNLKKAHVLIVGVGGVGAYAAESIVRAGVGEITLIDGDEVDITNCNRQIIALQSTIGMRKVDVMAERLKDINPHLIIHTQDVYLKDESLQTLFETSFDYIVDAIDSLSSKAWLIHHAVTKGVKIIVSLGSAGKTDPLQIKIAQLNQTHGCPLAKALRRRLLGLGCDLKQVQTVFSPEPCGGETLTFDDENQIYGKRSARGTISYMPAMFGLMMSSVVIQNLSKNKTESL